jgi:hypothetical protein
VTDLAGNTRSATAAYRVVYKFDGFKQPVNDASLTAGTPTSIFKNGSTVPLQFSLRNAQGQVVYPRALPQWLGAVKGAKSTATVNESANSGGGSSGSSYGPVSSSTWGYDWSTKGLAAGYLWTVGVKLDDGTTHLVTVGLR